MKQCPFCGCVETKSRRGGFGEYTIVCCTNNQCGAEGAPKKTVDEAELAWNYRAADAEIERLRAAIKETLDKNGHLADGENCTLIDLKRAIGYEDAL